MATLKLETLLAEIEAQLAADWRDIVGWLREQNTVEDIAQRLQDGLAEGLIVGVEDAASRFAAAVHDAYVESGQQAATWLDGLIAAALVTFDASHWRTTAWAQSNTAELRALLMSEQRETAWAVAAEGVRAGRTYEAVAGDIRGAIGLTSAQAQHVMSYRRALESGDYINALTRELRDARSDKTLEAAIRVGTAIPPGKVDAMVRRYEAGWLSFRADTLALHEGSYAVFEGAREMNQQLIDAGATAQLKYRWRSRRDAKVRDTHVGLDGQVRAQDRPFESSSGALLRYPRDPLAPRSETRGCRCKLELVHEA